MKLCVLSDSHTIGIDALPEELRAALSAADLIVHAGDFTEIALLRGLQVVGEVKAVCGNMDSLELRQTLPQRLTFTIEGKRIGLVHGSGGREGIAERVRDLFDDADIIIYGHSHESGVQTLRGSLMVNPGPARHSYAVVTIGRETKAEIIRI